MLIARRKILAMLHSQRLTVEEAEELLDAVEPGHAVQPSIPRPEYGGVSAWAQAFRRELQTLARSQGPVLIEGEEGTGKMQATQVIHYWSQRAGGPLVNLVCTAAADTIEGELFGYAVSGSAETRKGILDMANGGTLALGNPDLLPVYLQEKLVSFLKTGSYTRVGGSRPVYADVRIVANSHRHLAMLVEEGTFLPSLYEALSVNLVQARPLRENPEDVPFLARYFADSQAEREGRDKVTISAEAAQALEEYDWPLNARELSQVIRKALVDCDGEEIRTEHLPALGA